MEPRTWTKILRNDEPYVWFDWMQMGWKTIECRILRDDWLNVAVGDNIYFYDYNSERQIKTIITSITHANTFGELYNQFEWSMVPVEKMNSKRVDEIYSLIYDKEKDAEDLKMYGVVAVGVKVINE